MKEKGTMLTLITYSAVISSVVTLRTKQTSEEFPLQPVIIGMLSELNMECSIDPRNKGKLVVTASQLQQYMVKQTRSLT